MKDGIKKYILKRTQQKRRKKNENFNSKGKREKSFTQKQIRKPFKEFYLKSLHENVSKSLNKIIAVFQNK